MQDYQIIECQAFNTFCNLWGDICRGHCFFRTLLFFFYLIKFKTAITIEPEEYVYCNYNISQFNCILRVNKISSLVLLSCKLVDMTIVEFDHKKTLNKQLENKRNKFLHELARTVSFCCRLFCLWGVPTLLPSRHDNRIMTFYP